LEAPREFLKTVPQKPGVYQMFSAAGALLYVGKARVLRQRLASYFQKNQLSAKVAHLMNQVDKIETIVTPTEHEALLLESNLIKKHKPRYNVLLRDDKSYPYIYLSDHPFPRLDIYRGSKALPGRYFGPYPSAGAVRETIHLLQKIFRIRQCRDSFFNARSRPCLQYQIKRCTAPCVGKIDEAQYADAVTHVKLFLEGKGEALIGELVKAMEIASDNRAYETAARLRDQIAQLRQIQAQQLITTEGGDVDVVAIVSQEGRFCVQVITIRGGRMLGSKAYFPKAPKDSVEDEVMSAFMSQYYLNPVRQDSIPPKIIVNLECVDADLMAQALTQTRGKKVLLQHRVRGERAGWLKMAVGNAELALSNHVAKQINMFQRFEALQAFLKLDALPERVECFDISHSQGEATVASCVVFDREGPRTQDYRRFNIEGVTPGDDVHAIGQALKRRYQRIKKEEGTLPDVVIVDGGKGQLHEAEKVLESCQISSVTLMGIAKGPARKAGLETLFISGYDKEVHLKPDDLALHGIQYIRDEAHRFAITGHRARRGKQRTTSSLEQIPGVGAKRRQQLLKHFGGWQGVTQATVEQLGQVPGVSRALAERIYDALH
jgi:excinuclease ABC subunit C